MLLTIILGVLLVLAMGAIGVLLSDVSSVRHDRRIARQHLVDEQASHDSTREELAIVRRTQTDEHDTVIRQRIKIKLQRDELTEVQRQVDKHLRGEGVPSPDPVTLTLVPETPDDTDRDVAMRALAAVLTVIAPGDPVTLTHSDVVGVQHGFLWEQHNRDGSVTFGVRV